MALSKAFTAIYKHLILQISDFQVTVFQHTFEVDALFKVFVFCPIARNTYFVALQGIILFYFKNTSTFVLLNSTFLCRKRILPHHRVVGRFAPPRLRSIIFRLNKSWFLPAWSTISACCCVTRFLLLCAWSELWNMHISARCLIDWGALPKSITSVIDAIDEGHTSKRGSKVQTPVASASEAGSDFAQCRSG